MAFGSFARGVAVGQANGQVRKITSIVPVVNDPGPIFTLPIGRVVAPFTITVTSADPDLSVNLATGVVSSAAGIAPTVLEALAGKLTGADGVVLPFAYNFVGMAGNLPVPPTGYVFATDTDGAYALDADGAYAVEPI